MKHIIGNPYKILRDYNILRFAFLVPVIIKDGVRQPRGIRGSKVIYYSDDYKYALVFTNSEYYWDRNYAIPVYLKPSDKSVSILNMVNDKLEGIITDH